MQSEELPAWPGDSLSTYFAMAERNERASSLNYPAIYALLVRTNAALEKAEAAAYTGHEEELLIPRFLVVRVRSAFLAACRLAMSGQIAEAYPVLRSAIEHAWYALHIAKQPPLVATEKDPAPMPRWEVWLRRSDDEASHKRCEIEFRIGNVRPTHEHFDPKTARELHDLYKTLIDFGAHPNEQGLLTSMRRSDGDKETSFEVAILAPHEMPLMFTLRFCIAVAIGALKVFQLIFPERFEIMSLDLEIGELVGLLNSSFKPWPSNGGAPDAE